MNKSVLLTALIMLTVVGYAQPKWKKSMTVTQPPLELFHSTMTANFPTTETLHKGDFMYEISHRFIPSIKDGYDAYFGLDGPARIRTAVSYGITGKFMATIGRSNETDNVDLRVKGKLMELRNKSLPTAVAVRLGMAWNTEVPVGIDRSKSDADNFQYYVQVVVNTMLFNRKLGVGIVPSWLYNSYIYAREKQYSFTLGNYYQFFFNKTWSLWLENNPTLTGYRGVTRLDETGRSHNSLSTGIDISTGGHVFHLFVTNNARLNPSQFLVGADRSAGEDMWRLGFGVTRHL
ncbi:MAG: DUF5777 family beta-barrel protein [Calditrichia bacterium]